MSLDLVFASKGSAGVLSELARMKQGAKLANDELKKDNQALLGMSREVNKAFNASLAPIDKLRQQAEQMRKAIANTKLPDDVRAKAARALEDIDGKIKDIEKNSAGAKKNLGDAFGEKAVGMLKGFGSASALVATTLATIHREMRAAQELVNKATATQTSVAAARNMVTRNLPGVSRADRERVLSENVAIARELGIEETIVHQARADALSASGGDVRKSLAATRVAAQYLADQGAGAVSTQAGALLDLGVARRGSSALSNQGFLVSVAGLARPKDAKAQAQSIAPAIIGGVANGLTDAEAGALFAALTTGSGDTTGQESATSTIGLAQSLRSFVSKQLEGVSTGQRLRALQQDPELAKGFFGKLTGVGIKQKAFVEELILGGPDSPAARQYAANLSKLSGGRAAFEAEGRQSIAALSQVNKLETRAAMARRIAAFGESTRVDASQTTLSDEEREVIYEAMQRAGMWSTSAGLEMKVAAGMNGLQFGEAAELIRGRSIALLGRSKYGTSDPVEAARLRQQSAEYQAFAEELRAGNRELIQVLKDEFTKNTDAVRESGGLTANGT